MKIPCVDKELGVQCNPRFGYCVDNNRFVPVEMMDVAGLVPGAHEGKGMGNKFLDDLRQAHVLIHVVDISGSTDEKGNPVEPGSYDPAYDVKFLEIELDMWYLSILKKGWDRFSRQVQQEQRDISEALGKQLSGLNVTEEMVKDVLKQHGLPLDNPVAWSEEDLHKMAVELRKRTKPMVIAANKIDVASGEANLQRLKEQFPDYHIIGCSAESELALREAAKKELIRYIPGSNTFEITGELSEKQQQALEFIKNMLEKFGSTGLQETINTAVLELLNYIAVFPGGVSKLEDQHGNVLPDCFLLPPNSTALNFAYEVHTDFGKNFVKAIDVRTKRAVGREHMLNHRDVIEIIAK